MSTPESEPLTSGEVAQILGVSTDRVRQLIRDGRLPHTRSRLGRLYAREDVEAFDHARQLSRSDAESSRD
jgi:excisionase family DNA binding protein